MDSEIQKIEKHLIDNSLYTDAVYKTKDIVEIEIRWGDWKSDHLRCKYLMKGLGYIQEDIKVTEEDGSDCYSAVHSYRYIAV